MGMVGHQTKDLPQHHDIKAPTKSHHPPAGPISDQELLHLHQDSSLSRRELQNLINNSPSAALPPISTPQPMSLDGFSNILNIRKWHDTLSWLEHQFDPTALLKRKHNIAAPQGTALISFLYILKASTHLLSQFQQLDPSG